MWPVHSTTSWVSPAVRRKLLPAVREIPEWPTPCCHYSRDLRHRSCLVRDPIPKTTPATPAGRLHSSVACLLFYQPDSPAVCRELLPAVPEILEWPRPTSAVAVPAHLLPAPWHKRVRVSVAKRPPLNCVG